MTATTQNNTNVNVILSRIESQKGKWRKAFFRKKASTEQTIKPIIAKASEK